MCIRDRSYPTMTVDAFLKNTENFHSWLTNSVGYKLSPKIKIADGRDTNQGRFILATEDIKTDELLFEIPRESILNVLTSSLVSEYPAWENILLDGDVGHWEGLIICMLFEIKVKKNMSKWAPYFDVLPESTDLNSLMYWTAEELEALKPSLVSVSYTHLDVYKRQTIYWRFKSSSRVFLNVLTILGQRVNSSQKDMSFE